MALVRSCGSARLIAAVAQGMGAEATAVHELTTLTTGASGAAYAAEDIALVQ